MEKKLPVMLDGHEIGSGEVSRQGLYLHFRADCGPVTGRVLHLRLVGVEGTIPLGVPVPEQGRLRFEKRIAAGHFPWEGECLELYEWGKVEDKGYNGGVNEQKVEVPVEESGEEVEKVEGKPYSPTEPLDGLEHWEELRTRVLADGTLEVVSKALDNPDSL